MKKEDKYPLRFNSITEFHQVFGLPKPLHPMLSFIDNTGFKAELSHLPDSFILDLYKISYKTSLCGQVKYGQNHYDFGEGGLIFTAPNQVFGTPNDTLYSGCTLLIHPDFFASYPLAKNIHHFGFFSYSANEALHLSEKEKNTIFSVFENIDDELKNNIDDFSQDVMIAQVELLLNYCNRFYRRQFITRKVVNNDLLLRLEEILNTYFDDGKPANQGLPSVQYISGQLNISPGYLSDMLRSLTGKNTQQHIHHKLIEKAKEKLSSTNLSISEIAYELGYEHLPSFSKLFKTKTNLSPLEFRKSFN